MTESMLLDPQIVAKGWLDAMFPATPRDEADQALHAWATNLVRDAVYYDGPYALQIMGAVLELTDDPKHLGYLAGGPLSDLISHHQMAIMDTVEEKAHREPRFAALLGEVWLYDVEPELRERLNCLLLEVLPDGRMID